MVPQLRSRSPPAPSPDSRAERAALASARFAKIQEPNATLRRCKRVGERERERSVAPTVRYNSRMSDQEVILRALARVRGRLRLRHAVHDLAVVLGMIAGAFLLWRALRLAGDSAPAMTAAAILIALLLWAGGLLLLLRGSLMRRTSLARAAVEADRRAALGDELKTAYWFIEHPMASPWIAAQIERAARSAGALDVSRLLPLRVTPG